MSRLIFRTELSDDARIDLWLSHGVAATPDLSVYLTPSGGRRKTGRATRYFLMERGKGILTTVTAHTDHEATDLANTWLAKHCEVAA